MREKIDSVLLSIFIDAVTKTIFAADIPVEKQVDIMMNIERNYKDGLVMELEKVKHTSFTYEK